MNSAGDTPGFWPAGDAGRFLEDRSFVVPVLGAGVSVGAGLPGAPDLAAWIVTNVPPAGAGYTNAAGPTLFAVAGEAGDARELRRGIASWISEFELRPTALTEALVRAPSNFIVTLNYDLLLEETARQAGIECESLTSDEDGLKRALDLVSDLEHWPPKRLVVLHLHGSVDSPEMIVLDPSSYQRLPNDGRFSALVWFLMRQKTMLFMGTTLDELHLLSEMRKARSDTRHVLLCREDQKAALTGGRAGIAESRDGIMIATFSTYADLDGFAAKLATVNPVPIPPTPAIAGPRERALAFGYVPTVLVEHGAAGPDEAERLAAVFFDSTTGPEPLGEIDVALGQRTLVVGAPGSGKSELLREAGSRVPEDESAVLIRCAEMQVESGDASTILASWAARGEGLRGAVEVGSEAIAQRRFHFFFDGLDETLISEQNSLARLIADVARAFPQHRFTIATRAVDAIGVFQFDNAEHGISGEWRVLELAPDRDWQQRYLAEAGVSLDDLEAQMPALRDLSELLQLPFFLSQTVELYRAGGLREARDLWALVQNFVTSALDREVGIKLPKNEARMWLRDVALAMHLAGRTSLHLEELAEVPLPTAVETLVGVVEALTDTLIARLLMLKQGNHAYGFTHRIIGEALAAEALHELPPQGALLEAVAPQIDTQVSAVRSDWLVPLAFLMRRNPTWRAAVAERDPLAAARSVPSSAPTVERRDAARTIWETYVELGVWIWDYGSPDLLQDINALAHLLQAGDLDDLVVEIRQRLDDPSPQVQGNALRVLSRVNPDGFVDDVRRVLEDNHRESVVRRQAAVAAREMGAKELLPLIIKRAADPTNDMEAQDFSLCAFELAGEDDLIETALQLAGSRYGRIFAESRLKEVASTSELVRFLRASAEAEPESTSHETALLSEALTRIVSETDRATIRDAAFVAALWDARSVELRDLIEQDPQAALEGFLGAIQTAPSRLYFLMMLLDMFSLEALEAASAPESVLERKRLLLAQQPPAGPVSPPRAPASAGRDAEPVAVPAATSAGPHRAPTLSELLRRNRDQCDEVIAHGAQIFASQVASLSPEETEDLRARLDDWWPEKPYGQTITRESPNSWRQENLAAGWLWFGPPLDKALDARQWAELASCGILFDDQTSWLRRHANSDSVQQLAETCKATDSRVWQQALAATPDPLPDELVNAVVGNLRTAEEEHYEVRFIGQRLLAAAGTQPLRDLSEVSPQFAASLRPLLAGAGDEDAQRTLVRALREQLQAHQRPTGRDLNWLDAILNEDLLDDLFACVELLWGPTPAVQETQTWFTVDVATPVMNAIRKIGGRGAIERYDALIAKQGGFQFLHDQREAVAQEMLRSGGLIAAQQAAGELGIPAFASLAD